MIVNRSTLQWPLILALMALGLASFGVYKVKELEDEMRAGDEVSSYSLYLDNGTHLIHIKTKWNEEENETSSFAKRSRKSKGGQNFDFRSF